MRPTLALALALAACASGPTGERLPAPDVAPAPATDPRAVVVLEARPDRPFVVVGRVWAASGRGHSPAALVGTLKREAAKLGGHAIVLLAAGAEPVGWLVSATTTRVAGTSLTTAQASPEHLTTYTAAVLRWTAPPTTP